MAVPTSQRIVEAPRARRGSTQNATPSQNTATRKRRGCARSRTRWSGERRGRRGHAEARCPRQQRRNSVAASSAPCPDSVRAACASHCRCLAQAAAPAAVLPDRALVQRCERCGERVPADDGRLHASTCIYRAYEDGELVATGRLTLERFPASATRSAERPAARRARSRLRRRRACADARAATNTSAYGARYGRSRASGGRSRIRRRAARSCSQPLPRERLDAARSTASRTTRGSCTGRARSTERRRRRSRASAPASSGSRCAGTRSRRRSRRTPRDPRRSRLSAGARYGDVLDALHARGIAALVTLYGSPRWANGGAAPNRLPDDRLRRLRVRRGEALPVGPHVDGLERAEQPRSSRSRSRRRSTSQRVLNPGVRGVAPGVARANLVAGGVTSPRKTPTGMSPLAYMQGMHAAHARLDAYAQNPYPLEPRRDADRSRPARALQLLHDGDARRDPRAT